MQPSHQRAEHGEAKPALTLAVLVSVHDNCPPMATSSGHSLAKQLAAAWKEAGHES